MRRDPEMSNAELEADSFTELKEDLVEEQMNALFGSGLTYGYLQ